MSHITEFFNKKTILLTGGTGFLGMCLAEKLLRSTNVSRIYILVRGSADHLTHTWRKHLPNQSKAMIGSGRVTPLVGDLVLPQLGLSPAEIEELSRTVQIVIHVAANISLVASLATVFKDNVQASLDLAELASNSFARLERYIHISTAYVNSYLPNGSHIKEEFYWPSSDAEAEYRQVSLTGDSPYTKLFPYPYTYGKHLTERLLVSRYPNFPLLIVRPTSIGPAEHEPEPGFEVRASSPITGAIFGFFLSAFDRRVAYWPSANNKNGANMLDEAPVDYIVNNIIAHTAYGTCGIVHSCSSRSSPTTLREILERAQAAIPAAQRPELVFKSDLKYKGFCRTAKLFAKLTGEWFYDDRKTMELIQRMSTADRKAFSVDLRNFDAELYNSRRAAALWFEIKKNERIKRHKNSIMPAGQATTKARL